MPARLSKFFHSRYAMLLAAVLMALAAWLTYASGELAPVCGDRGVALPSANCWLPSGPVSLWAGVGMELAVIAVMMAINRTYNLLRSLSMLFGVLYAFMAIATSELTAQFYTGPLLALTLACCVALMFGSYGRSDRRREVFLVFFMLSAGTATRHSFAVYIPVMALCCAQMRLMSVRTVVAALLGIVAPWWLLFGLGIVAPAGVHLPSPVALLSTINFSEGVQLAVTVSITAIIFVAAIVLDFFRTMAYNARARAYNGAIVAMGFVTILAMALDYNNVSSYIPTLNMCASLQAAQFFVIHRSERSWIGITSVIAVYAALFVWKILI